MGQYHLIVNLDAREFLDPHKLGVGLKAWEQIANHPSTPDALFILLTCSNGRGGGDFEDHTRTDGERVIGRWAGNRIAVIGDYAEDSDLGQPLPHRASQIYGLCRDGSYRDITAYLRAVLSKELGVRYEANDQGSEYEIWRVCHDPDAAFSVLEPETIPKKPKGRRR